MNDHRLERRRRRMVARHAREGAGGSALVMKFVKWLLVAAAIVTMLLGLFALWRTS